MIMPLSLKMYTGLLIEVLSIISKKKKKRGGVGSNSSSIKSRVEKPNFETLKCRNFSYICRNGEIAKN